MELLAHQLAVLLIAIMQVVTLNLVVGKVGVWSVGHLAFFGIGGFAAAEVLVRSGGTAIAIIPALLAAALAAGAASALVGFATLRLRQDFFVILSFAFVVLMRNVAVAWKGPDGMIGVPRPQIGPLDLSDEWTVVVVVLLPFTLLLIGLAARFGRLPLERACALVRSHEDAARLLGRSPFYYRFGTFVIASVAVGLAGACAVIFHGAAGPTPLGITPNLMLFAAMLLGGINSLLGSVVGAVISVAVTRLLESVVFVGPTASYYSAQGSQLLFGLLILLTVRVLPGGLAGGTNRGGLAR